MNEYKHPGDDIRFVLDALVDFDGLVEELSLDGVDAALAEAVIDEAGRIASEVIAPSNVTGDAQGATLSVDGVCETPGFAEVYRQFAEGGWMSLTADAAYGGQELPGVLGTAVNEIWQSANLAWGLCPMLTVGAVHAIARHASDRLKDTFLPPMVAGEWTGTMNLTEADAGSDLAAIKTRAEPVGDSYRISGQKIFITWGDHQMSSNIVHLVLARLPGAPPGVKGISLFVVPKFLLDDAGQPAARNSVSCLSLEHKLGIHGSPTCTMLFDDAIAYLVGEPHKGLAYMFTMMNHARQAVGVQGLGVSERAYQQASQYARERLQGTRKDGSRIPIIRHPDVRRMLLTMKSLIEAMRALALVASAESDRAEYRGTPEARARAELYTPLVKGWLTEMANEVTSLGVQVHGGMGYIEETGAAQFMRDARILNIYEGTTGIQALDFIGRKTLADSGDVLKSLLDDLHRTYADAREADCLSPAALDAYHTALAGAHNSCVSVLERAGQEPDFAPAVAYHFLMQFGYVVGGWLLLRSAVAATHALRAGVGDQAFLTAKCRTASFYCEQILPRADSHGTAVSAGSGSVVNFDEDSL